MVEKMTFAAVAEKVGISPDKVRHWGKALGITPAKIRGVCYLESSSVEILEEMKKAIDSGLSPSAAAVLVRAKPEAANPIPVPAPAAPLVPSEFGARFDSLEKVILLLVDEVRGLRQENADLRSRLEPPAPLAIEPPKPIKAWSPVRVQPPVMPWYQRVFLEMFQPEALRVAEG